MPSVRGSVPAAGGALARGRAPALAWATTLALRALWRALLSRAHCPIGGTAALGSSRWPGVTRTPDRRAAARGPRKSESRKGLASFLQVQLEVDSGPAGEAATSARRGSLTAPEAETAAGTQLRPGQRRRLSAGPGVSVGLLAVRLASAGPGVAGNGPGDKPAAMHMQAARAQESAGSSLCASFNLNLSAQGPAGSRVWGPLSRLADARWWALRGKVACRWRPSGPSWRPSWPLTAV